MKTARPRFQQGTVRRVKRASGFAWEVRLSEADSLGQRKRKTIIFDSNKYPTKTSVRKDIQNQVALANDANGLDLQKMLVKKLLDNAIRGAIDLEVQERGPGIPPHERARLPDAFDRIQGNRIYLND